MYMIPPANMNRRADEFAKNEAPKVAAHMANQYLAKKRAYEALNTSFKKTGSLDISRLASYKTSDDIFISKSMTKNGKSHGIYMVMDWSASMRDNVRAMATQFLTTAMFCKKANIPFVLDIFTSSTWYSSRRRRVPQDLNSTVSFGKLSQITIATSDMSMTEITYVYRYMMDQSLFWKFFSSSFPSDYVAMLNQVFAMSGTPLYESKLATYVAATEFKQKYKIQNVTVMYITDGDGSFLVDRSNKPATSVVCPFTGRRYEISTAAGSSCDTTTMAINRMFRDAGFKIFNMFITTKKSTFIYKMNRFGEYIDWKTLRRPEGSKHEVVTVDGLTSYVGAGNYDGFLYAPIGAFGEVARIGKVDTGQEFNTSKDFVKSLRTKSKLTAIGQFIIGEICKDFTKITK